MTCFTTQDALIKLLSGDYPLHELVFARATIAIGLTLVMMHFEGGVHMIFTRRPGLHLARGALLVFANSTFFMAVAAMPLAEVVTVFFVAPLLIALMSTFVLGEHIGPRRWAAIAVGLLGVIVMMRPGPDTFQAVALLPLIAATCYAGVQTVTRRLGVTDRASVMAFYIQITFIVISAGIGLAVGDGRFEPADGPSLQFVLRAWRWPAEQHVPVFIAIGILNAAGAYLMSQGYRISNAASVAPFEYVALPISMMWGIVLFSEWPDAVALLGIALVLGSGLYVIHREIIAARRRASTRPDED